MTMECLLSAGCCKNASFLPATCFLFSLALSFCLFVFLGIVGTFWSCLSLATWLTLRPGASLTTRGGSANLVRRWVFMIDERLGNVPLLLSVFSKTRDGIECEDIDWLYEDAQGTLEMLCTLRLNASMRA